MSRDPKSTYYDAGGIETLDVIKAKLTPEQYRGYLLGNAIKYACRFNFKGSSERDAEKLAIYSKELAAIAYKQGSGCMTAQRYELLDLSSADGPRAMVTESEEGTYMLHADHVEEVAALKARIAELEEGIARCRQQASYFIGNEEALKNQLSKVRDIANEVLISKGAS